MTLRLARRHVLLLALVITVVGLVVAWLRPTPDQDDRMDTVPALTDAQGRALVLRGFSTAGSAKGSPDGLPDFEVEDLEREYADMGTNFVRFLISWRAVEPRPGQYDQSYLDGVAERVDWYAERGYQVMLDMHQDLWGNEIIPGAGLGNGAPGWATFTDDLRIDDHDMWELYYLEPGVIRAFDNFWNTTGRHPELTKHYAGAWRAVAERFADVDNVIAYDLMNEPYGGSLQGPAFEAGPLTALYQDLTDAIREVDSDTWMCLEPQAMGVNWGTASGLRPIRDPRPGDPRVALCPHLYPLPMDLGGGYESTTRTLVRSTIQTWLANTLQTAERLGDVPVVLGEFGLDTTLPGALDYVEEVYDVADRHGFAVAYWSRDAGPWGPYEADGTARNLVGALDRPYPRAVAGRVGAIESTPTRLKFAVSPGKGSDDGAPTEIYLPASFLENDEDIDQEMLRGAELLKLDAERRVLSVRVKTGAREVVVQARP